MELFCNAPLQNRFTRTTVIMGSITKSNIGRNKNSNSNINGNNNNIIVMAEAAADFTLFRLTVCYE